MAKPDYQAEAGLVENLSQNRFWPAALLLVTGFATLFGTALFIGDQITLLEVNDDLVRLGGDFFLKYLFLVVAIERAAAVFVEIFRKQSKVNWNLRINRITEVLGDEDVHLDVLKQVYARERRIVNDLVQTGHLHAIAEVQNSSASKGDYLGFLTSAKHGYEFLRAQYVAAGNRYVARIVFIVAVILSALGLSLLQDILGDFNAVNDGLGSLQQGLLRFSDTLITGGLLGGGSAGLNGIANKLNDFLNRN